MTSTNVDSLIDMDDPLGLTDLRPLTQQQIQWLKEQEQVRERHVAVFSSSPLYQARAAKDPAYWQTFSAGGIR